MQFTLDRAGADQPLRHPAVMKIAVPKALWSAVAAATAFLAPPLANLTYEPKAEGGSCCCRTPRRFVHFHRQRGGEFRSSSFDFRFMKNGEPMPSRSSMRGCRCLPVPLPTWSRCVAAKTYSPAGTQRELQKQRESRDIPRFDRDVASQAAAGAAQKLRRCRGHKR